MLQVNVHYHDEADNVFGKDFSSVEAQNPHYDNGNPSELNVVLECFSQMGGSEPYTPTNDLEEYDLD